MKCFQVFAPENRVVSENVPSLPMCSWVHICHFSLSYEFAGAVMMKCHRLGGVEQQTRSPHSPEATHLRSRPGRVLLWGTLLPLSLSASSTPGHLVPSTVLRGHSCRNGEQTSGDQGSEVGEEVCTHGAGGPSACGDCAELHTCACECKTGKAVGALCILL